MTTDERQALDFLAAQLEPMTHQEWMHLYHWPPGFVSVGATPKGPTPPVNNRANGGFDRHPVSLPGNVEYVQRGLPQTMERAK
jgi:hypothetical protein